MALTKECPTASIQQKGTAFYCQFYYHGRRHTVTIMATSPNEVSWLVTEMLHSSAWVWPAIFSGAIFLSTFAHPLLIILNGNSHL